MVEEQPLVASAPSEWDGFNLPFPVATLEELGQRAYLTHDQIPEWLFARVHAFCCINTEPGRLLRQNLDKIKEDFATLQVAAGKFHFRGIEEQQAQPNMQWKDHTLESGGLFAILLWLMRNRALKAMNKLKALNLLLGLASCAFGAADLHLPLQGILTNKQGVLVSRELTISPQQICYSWGAFLRLCPGAVALWQHLGQRCWLNKCISSSIDTASFSDIWFFLVYIWCHPKLKKAGQCIFQCLGKSTLPDFLDMTARWLDAVAISKSKAALQMLPSLKTKAGNARKVADPVNKILLLFKLRKEQLHRKRVADTHDELGGATNRMIVFENYLDVLLHMQALQKSCFGPGSNQLSITWDPSTYGGKEILMSIAYHPQADAAAYLLSQELSHTMMSELDLSLVPLAQKRKLKRLEGFREMKGLSCALGSIGLSLVDFQVPTGLICRPLNESEFRVKGPDGLWYIYNEETQTQVVEVPADMDLGAVPCLLSISDQGPNNLAALHFLTLSSEAFMMWTAFDPYHRAWNDLKNALKRSTCGGWRTVLELTLVANLNYGPFGSSSWFFKKKSKLEDFLACNTIHSPVWKRYQHLICQEQGIPEPNSEAEAEDLFDSLKSLESFNQKGPLIKLMRWFSFFESMLFHKGQLWATKMVIEHQAGEEAPSEKEVPEGPPKPEQDHRKELQELKKRKGTWKLAPELVTGKSLCIKDIVMSVGKASWQTFSAMARDLLSPIQVLQHNIACATSNFWASEIEAMLRTSLYDKRHLQHLSPQFRGHPDALVWHCDVLDKLLETRSMSLASFHCLPPGIYSHALSPSPTIAKPAFELAARHFSILLEAESAQISGASVTPLDYMHWRHNPLLRTLYLAYEQDKALRRFGRDESSALKLQRVLSQHLGDSRVIENIHQHGRDIFRNSKANSISNTAIMANVLRSGVLEQRKVSCITSEQAAAAKATQGTWQQQSKSPVVSSLRTHGKKLTTGMQKMLVPQTSWPSPNPASLFTSAAATQWLFTFWNAKDGVWQGCDVNASWLSFLPMPGAMVAQRSTSAVIKVLASSMFAFLGVAVNVARGLDGGPVYTCSCKRDDVQWYHCCSLDDWLHLHVEPFLLHADGTLPPVAWKAAGDPLTLEAAALCAGHVITYQQAKKLLQHLGGPKLPGNSSKKLVMETLIGIAVPEELQDLARGHLEEGKQEDMDSELSEVISELGQDDANIQDLKSYKEKKRSYKLRKQLAKQDDEEVKGKKRKPRAKGKAKAKAKAKAKMSFGQALFKRAQKLQKEREDEERAEALEEMEQKSAEAEISPPPSPGQPSSSGQLPPAPPAEEPPVPPPEEPPVPLEEPPAAEAPSEAAAKKARVSPADVPADRRKSPEEILAYLQPPGCRFGLSFKDHRWTSVWKNDHPRLEAPYKQLSFTKSFAQKKGWQDAIREVHAHNWKKWALVKCEYPLPPDTEEQIPGQVPQDILEQLKGTVRSLGEVIRYPRK